MTPQQLQKHKAHCDMHNCEICKSVTGTPSSNEREQLENDLLDVVGMLPFLERGRTLAPFMYPELVDFILQDRQSTRTQALEEVERDVIGEHEAPKNKACWECYPEVNCRHEVRDDLRDEQRALLQRKKGK